MFAKLVKSLFPSLTTKKVEANYHYFETSRAEEDGLSKKTVDDIQKQLNTSAENNTLITSSVIKKAGITDAQREQFFSYLFGDVSSQVVLDPLSEFVSKKIESLLVYPRDNPQLIFNSLPVLPLSVTTIMAEINKPDFDVNVLITTISQEPSMATEVIKLANSAGFQRSSKPVTDLKSAFMAMGSKGLLQGVIYSYLKRFVPSPNVYYKQFGDKIWQHCLQCGAIAQAAVASSDIKEQANTAYFVGLVCNLGVMVIFQIMIEAFSHVSPDEQPNTLAFQLLVERYGQRLSFEIAKYWQLPEPILRALALQLKIKPETPREKVLPQNRLGFFIYEANKLSELQALWHSKLIDENELELRSDHYLKSQEIKRCYEQFITVN